jgi:transposase-like protein/transposase Tn5 family protein
MSWVEDEMEYIDIGDQRLNQRALSILEGLGLAPGRTIPQAFQAWSEIKATYNFFNNDLVSEEKILESHLEKTIERIKEYPVVILPSDTTEINYTTKNKMKDKERLCHKQNGIWLHATIAITPDRLNLGLVQANFWHRESEVAKKDGASKKARDKAPINEKESYRWLESYQRACDIAKAAPETQIISIHDRECDMIEFFELADSKSSNEPKANFIIRSQYDRLIESNNNEEDGTVNNEEKEIVNKLWEKLRKADSLGEQEFTITSRGDRKARKVKQKLKAVSVTLTPFNKKKSIVVNAVMAIEENPPEGEEPITWILITDLPIKTFKDVCKIIEYYLCRWQIELFFKVLKSGCKIEERQLQTADRIKNLISIFFVIAWRVMFTMMLGRICGEMSCGDIFDEAEWKSVYKILNKKKALPRKPPLLGEFIVMIAKLGGYVEQKNGEPPGIKTMWKGMARMVDFSIAWEAFGT